MDISVLAAYATHSGSVTKTLGKFSNDDGDGSENVTIKIIFAFFQTSSQLFQLALNVKCSRVKFSGDEFLETAPKFRKRKKNYSSCVYDLHKTCHQEISRPSGAVTAKKCTKKCNARAELLFWLQTLLPF